MKNKYCAKKTIVDGIEFDSKHEAMRYRELTLLQRAGRIFDLQRQVKFELIPAIYDPVERYGKNGKRLKDGKKLVERGVSYIADFVYRDDTGELIVEDAKGVRTSEYRIKRKLMLHLKNIRVHEV